MRLFGIPRFFPLGCRISVIYDFMHKKVLGGSYDQIESNSQIVTVYNYFNLLTNKTYQFSN